MALSQYSGAQQDPERAEEAEAHWSRAREAFDRAVELYGEPETPAGRRGLAEAAFQLGYVHAWKQDTESAAAAFTLAMGWDPSAVAFDQLFGILEAERYRQALAEGAEAFRERYGEGGNSDATLLWWLGYLSFATGEYEAADRAFVASVRKFPAYGNAWFYAFRSRYSQQDYPGALEALRTYWKSDPPGVIGMVQQELELNVSILEWVTSWCAREGDLGGAVFVSRVLAESQPDNANYWNNLGLFHRDHGAGLQARYGERASEEQRAETMDHFERSFAAYERALELVPGHPVYLNDGAVLLHYYLERDYDEALERYDRAAAQAEEWLGRSDLSDEDRGLVQIALRDARDNKRKLERKIEKEKKRRAREAEQEGGGSGS